jgi:hypothetical protein
LKDIVLINKNLWRETQVARVRIEDIIDFLDSDIRKALKDSVDKVIPNNNVDSHQLFREFKRSISRKCSTWERVPDQYVEND